MSIKALGSARRASMVVTICRAMEEGGVSSGGEATAGEVREIEISLLSAERGQRAPTNDESSISRDHCETLPPGTAHSLLQRAR